MISTTSGSRRLGLPTSLGVNPQLSIYAHARMFASEIPVG